MGLNFYKVNVECPSDITHPNISLSTDYTVYDINKHKSISLNKCCYCDSDIFLTKDHFYPKSKGGLFTITACYKCNQLKRNLTPRQWIDLATQAKIPNYKKIVSNTEKILIKLGVK